MTASVSSCTIRLGAPCSSWQLQHLTQGGHMTGSPSFKVWLCQTLLYCWVLCWSSSTLGGSDSGPSSDPSWVYLDKSSRIYDSVSHLAWESVVLITPSSDVFNPSRLKMFTICLIGSATFFSTKCKGKGMYILLIRSYTSRFTGEKWIFCPHLVTCQSA